MDRLLWEQIEDYLRRLETELSASPNTVAAYRNDLTQLYQYLLSTPNRGVDSGLADDLPDNGQTWSAVSRARIIGFVVALKEKGYASTTVARKIAAIKSFFHFLHSRNAIDVDPTETLDSPRIDKTIPRSLSNTEVLGLLEQLSRSSSSEDVRDNAMLRLLYAAGLRVSELVALNIDDLDFPSGSVRCINRAGRERIIPLDSTAVRALEEYVPSARNALIRRPDERALFVNHRGDRLTRQGCWLILKEHARLAGLPDDITPQTLRHSFAIRLLDDNTDLRAIQELLGHANIATTQMYTQIAARVAAGSGGATKPHLVGS
ncbi:MAG TPA: tyrosine-type recombinase/integrase [Chloroflexota bacterium]|nr:tyrosine-type recombinase/integrase [Chloroflexota bacterium]